jgi:NhaP-type Na+/H+ or K+/H+ antiporter
VTAGVFSLWEAGLSFVVGSIGRVLFGLAIGWGILRTRRYASQKPSIRTPSPC